MFSFRKTELAIYLPLYLEIQKFLDASVLKGPSPEKY